VARDSIFKFGKGLETFVQSQEGVRQKFKKIAVQQFRGFLVVRFVSGGRFGRFTR
jgi:hypothetical protein